jgi:hypothetical protein
MENCVEEPSSLGAAMPSVSEYAAVGPVAPLLPQLPQVSQGDSSTWSITVLLAVVAGVGVATGVGAGVGPALAVVALVLPPQEVSTTVNASANRAV